MLQPIGLNNLLHMPQSRPPELTLPGPLIRFGVGPTSRWSHVVDTWRGLLSDVHHVNNGMSSGTRNHVLHGPFMFTKWQRPVLMAR